MGALSSATGIPGSTRANRTGSASEKTLSPVIERLFTNAVFAAKDCYRKLALTLLPDQFRPSFLPR
jgi:hypothetical protein